MQDQLATLLADLRHEGRQQSGLDPELVPPDKESAYRIAGLVAAKLGWTVGGWKIAALKEEMQRALRTDAPIYGPVYRQFIRPSPAAFEARALLHPLSEIEYVATLGAGLPPRERPYTEEEVAGAVASLHPGLEIAECRFVHDAAFPPLPAILADGSGSGSIVYGPAIADWRRCDIADQEVVLRVNGVEKRRGTARAAIGHPVATVAWIANALSRAGVGLEAGQMISTGTLSGMVLARPGEEHVADFGPFGEVRVTFT